MKIPRDLSAQDLIKALKKYGYQVSRQSGSHIRLTSSIKTAEHHVTVPNHNPIKLGTLSGILKEIGKYLEINWHHLDI